MGLIFDTATADALMPLHLQLASSGHIEHAGPCLSRLRPDESLVGKRFLEVFEVRRPANIRMASDLFGLGHTRMDLRFRMGRPTVFKGLSVALAQDDRLLVDLSFGIGAVDAVRAYGLTASDFSATDQTVELLYLVEAKDAIMAESRNLNHRLNGAKIAAEEQAFTDTLTGLKNRRALDHVLERLDMQQAPFALMHLDLDYFKEVNDTLGHAAGDHVLQTVAQILVEETRAVDLAVRAGGDEFVLVFDGLTDRDALNGIADRILARLAAPIFFNTQRCHVSASIGTVTSTDYDRIDLDRMSHDADTALYASKNAGRARHTFGEVGVS